ncbi:hypothetical protein VA7868_01379 [Vibrio aerogenes CECT 7868]|uniref:Sel1 repeat protein n=1 Tax=Vibrio aerogenes CECT 7868 TaxID=1216006 RepID=A0A1M5XYH1_9VIBR|nr:tetratricopeptide repeat protein [Vibrio aerogenes]SHI04875.1 hypothetical protein VA7868_01379 [Vibrio aerogenes CECT 7868]
MIKKINLKLIMLFVLSLCVIAVLGFGGYVLYHIIPSGFQSRHAEGPKVLTELLHMAEQSKPFNPDPYIASTYRPENPLYQPVLAIQRGKLAQAEKLLKPLVEQGNAEAMFWLGEITYGSGLYSAGPAAKLFQKAAELGNPYAALRLDVDNSDCQRFMSGYCDDKWGKLGRKLLKQRADNGDVKAAYYLLKLDIDVYSDSAEVHKKLEQLVTESAKQHYYQPLMSLLGGYVRHGYYGPYLDKDSPVDKQDIALVNKILTLLANNNYPLALSTVIDDGDMFSSQYIDKVMSQLEKLGINYYSCLDYLFLREDKSRDNIVNLASCAIASDKISYRNHNLSLLEMVLKDENIDALTEDEISQAKEISEKMISKMTPVIYIDEINPPSP